MNDQNTTSSINSSGKESQEANIRPTSKILFKNALFQFYPLETGSVALFHSFPFGGAEPLLDRIAHLVDLKTPETKEEMDTIIEIYYNFYEDLPLIVASSTLNPGLYETIDIDKATKMIFDPFQEEEAKSEAAVEEMALAALKNSFEDYKSPIEVTPTHLAMLRATLWQIEDQFDPIRTEAENYLKESIPIIHKEAKKPEYKNLFFSYPIIAGEGKRPYGDLTYYYWDLEDLNVPGIKADGEMSDQGRRSFSEESAKKIDSIQQELYLVLQVMAQQMK